MKQLLVLVLSLLMWVGSDAANLTPILMADGNQKMLCDGQWRWMFTVELDNKTVVGSYLFGNLVTPVTGGADLVIWSPAYGGYGTLGDLHLFNAVSTGGRQGQHERMFPAGDGVSIIGPVHVGAICWGGGTLEIYAVIWVR